MAERKEKHKNQSSPKISKLCNLLLLLRGNLRSRRYEDYILI
jgi:hypothetical protein